MPLLLSTIPEEIGLASVISERIGAGVPVGTGIGVMFELLEFPESEFPLTKGIIDADGLGELVGGDEGILLGETSGKRRIGSVPVTPGGVLIAGEDDTTGIIKTGEADGVIVRVLAESPGACVEGKQETGRITVKHNERERRQKGKVKHLLREILG